MGGAGYRDQWFEGAGMRIGGGTDKILRHIVSDRKSGFVDSATGPFCRPLSRCIATVCNCRLSDLGCRYVLRAPLARQRN